MPVTLADEGAEEEESVAEVLENQRDADGSGDVDSEESSPEAGSDEAEDQDPLPRRSGRVQNTLRDDDLSMEGILAYRRKERFVSTLAATLQ